MRRAQKNTTDIVESLFEDEFKELCGFQVVMQRSPVGVSVANGAIENAIQRVCCCLVEYAAHRQLFRRIFGDDGLAARCRCTKVVNISKSEARLRCGVWIGSIEASDDHMIGTPRGVVKPTTAIARPDAQGFEGKAIDAMQGTPWRLSSKHRGNQDQRTNNRRGRPEEEEPEEIQMEIYDEEDRGERVEDIAEKQDVICSRIGQSFNFTIQSRYVLKCGPHLGCLGCKYIAGEVASQSGHSRECKIRIMVEMENKHRAREWYVAKGIDEGAVSFKDHDEERASEGGRRNMAMR